MFLRVPLKIPCKRMNIGIECCALNLNGGVDSVFGWWPTETNLSSDVTLNLKKPWHTTLCSAQLAKFSFWLSFSCTGTVRDLIILAYIASSSLFLLFPAPIPSIHINRAQSDWFVATGPSSYITFPYTVLTMELNSGHWYFKWRRSFSTGSDFDCFCLSKCDVNIQ